MTLIILLEILLLLIVRSSGFIPSNTFISNKKYYGTKELKYNERLSRLGMVNDKIGIFYGTSTGSTGEAAELIAEGLGLVGVEVDEPIDIDSVEAEEVCKRLNEYNSLIVGTPTWNTGADTERSGTGWDEIYYNEMQNLKLSQKKVGVFGLGDSVSYSENYGDATGELHDVLQNLGCTMMGYTSKDGYLHKSSKAIRENQFCGLLLDAVNQEDLTQERVTNWISQLMKEGILEKGVTTTTTTTPDKKPIEETNIKVTPVEVTKNSKSVEVEVPHVVNSELVTSLKDKQEGFIPRVNPITKKTMWISLDGKSCFFYD